MRVARTLCGLCLLGAGSLWVPGATLAADPAQSWMPLLPGVSYRAFEGFGDSAVGDRRLHVVRIDPARAPLLLRMVSREGGEARTAGDWCREEGLAVAFNAGMFNTDLRTHTGYLRAGAHLNSPRWVASYRSVLALGPDGRSATLLDLDASLPPASLRGHAAVVQNLRLIGGTARNAWKPGSKRWSEAALAGDRRGRLLVLFSRSPYSMHTFNRLVLRLPLGIERAQHLEGGPEASLSIHAGGVDLDLSGSYETGFHQGDDNHRQWALPNVLGVASDATHARGPSMRARH